MDGLESGEVEGYRVGVSGCELLALRTALNGRPRALMKGREGGEG